jgi:hypothetical protein
MIHFPTFRPRVALFALGWWAHLMLVTYVFHPGGPHTMAGGLWGAAFVFAGITGGWIILYRWAAERWQKSQDLARFTERAMPGDFKTRDALLRSAGWEPVNPQIGEAIARAGTQTVLRWPHEGRDGLREKSDIHRYQYYVKPFEQ